MDHTPPSIEDATAFILDCFKNPNAHAWIRSLGPRWEPKSEINEFPLWIVIQDFAMNRRGIQGSNQDIETAVCRLSGRFLDAAWELCRIGVMRPGSWSLQRSSNGYHMDQQVGYGFSLTTYGKTWVTDWDGSALTVLDASRFGEEVAVYKDLLGPGFYQRATEAARCHKAGAYLACCAMCGAAAESILLRAAAEKKDDEQAILDMYRGASGRSRVQSYLLGQSTPTARRAFESYFELLKYWRDDSAHGRESPIEENTAFSSMRLLLQLAHHAQQEWTALTS